VRSRSSAEIVIRRSAPRMIRSSEFVKSDSSIFFCSRRRGRQRRLVDQVAQVGADHAGRRGGDRGQVDVLVDRLAARVDLEDQPAAVLVGRVDRDPAVEAPGRRSAWSRISGRLVAARTMTPSEPGEAVHLGEDLVERLLALVVAAHAAARAAAGAADGVELVDEDDRRGGLLGLVEQVAHAGRADADDHLDELRGAEAEEGHVGLAGHGAGEQGLAGARRAAEQDALGDHRAEAPVLVRVLEEVDDLDELLLGLVDARDVLERRALLVGLVALGLRAAQAGQAARAAAGRAAHDEDEDADDQQRRAEEEQEVADERAAVAIGSALS
jgi:hypothetical protein